MKELGLGIKILFVALQEAHPNDDVAKSFQEVVKAEREKDNAIANARGMAEEILTEVAGSTARALVLDEAIRARDALASDKSATADAIAAADKRVTELLEGTHDGSIAATGGDAAKRIADAHGSVLVELTEARKALTLRDAELVGYKAAPKLYRMRKYLEMLQRSVQDIRKFVVLPNPGTRVIVIYQKAEQGTIEIDTSKR
jgi:regulator of protease activity HflC (stomatin/prohibitin superfamily)